MVLASIVARTMRRPRTFTNYLPAVGLRGLSDASTRLELIKSDKAKRSSLKPLKTKQHGVGILHDPLWNKGMAMTISE